MRNDSVYNLYPLLKTNLILLLFFLVIGGLYIAQTFLVPLAFAAILAMLLTPMCNKLEHLGITRPLAALICVLVLLLFFFGLGMVLSTQIASFTEQLPQIERQISQKLQQAQQFVQQRLGISPQEQQSAIQGQSGYTPGSITSAVIGFLGSFTSTLASMLLTLVYLYMLINYRQRFKTFILKLVSDEQEEKTRRVISDSSSVAQQYLVGRGMLILILAVMYSIGLKLIGLDNAILISLLAALVSIIPYIGNIIGVAIPLLMALAQGGDAMLFLGIIVVFSVAQFVESYILEPYVVGAEVDIHPFFTVVVIIAGEIIWGIPGMILAIPLVGILKIVMDNIKALHPYAYLIGDTEKNSETVSDKLKKWFS
jgi:predicted PurR-regulated permease PerM